jgi:3-oxoacyl-[acyl-carrier protein] reductase
MLLKNKTALITGAATGIGEGIARLFAQHGASLLLLDRNSEPLHAVASSISSSGALALPIVLDLRDRDAIDSAVYRTRAEIGQIDILINNAGIYPRQSFLEISEPQWDEMQSINLKSMFHTMQAVLPEMIKRDAGKIVNISSVTFHLGMENLSHYVASKGGVIGLTRSVAREMGPHNIHINCITPGAIEVEAERAFVSEDQITLWLDQQSLKRRLLPLDVARVCLFLASELSDGLTGQTLNVDGGWIMH